MMRNNGIDRTERSSTKPEYDLARQESEDSGISLADSSTSSSQAHPFSGIQANRTEPQEGQKEAESTVFLSASTNAMVGQDNILVNAEKCTNVVVGASPSIVNINAVDSEHVGGEASGKRIPNSEEFGNLGVSITQSSIIVTFECESKEMINKAEELGREKRLSSVIMDFIEKTGEMKDFPDLNFLGVSEVKHLTNKKWAFNVVFATSENPERSINCTPIADKKISGAKFEFSKDSGYITTTGSGNLGHEDKNNTALPKNAAIKLSLEI